MLIFNGEFWEPLWNKLGYLPSQLIVTYFFLYYLLPRLREKKYSLFLMGFVAMTYVSTVVARIFKIYFYETLTSYESDKESFYEILTQKDPLLVQYLIWVFMTPVLTIIIVMILNHYHERERLAQLRHQKSLTDLRFLKAQLHPHFLFNTLNNLYTLALQRSPKTPEITQRLYDMLYYIFNIGERSFVSLRNEIDLMSNYIQLEKLRYGERLNLTVAIDIDQYDHQIIPLMLLSIVENAFKHGASGDPGQPYIHITLKEKLGMLSCLIENSIYSVSAEDDAGYRKGIGIKNIKRQLELMYPGDHSYSMTETPQNYKVELVIRLRALSSSQENDRQKLDYIR